ncbi:hypothetical protein OIU77_028811 [Salix suchowensis]|uniref:Uncharacterized protein n=1 Tax=Salix suchowensis TaxID=1278906 RepID=A0ABQ9BJ23_9ROSI|nr:hypothetical protein OIU77_028811 [Salix suchowensis]
MAKLFASRGLKTTIVTTPLNVSLFSRTVQRTQNLGFDINIRTIEFSTAETGLPEGCENADFFISQAMGWEMVAKFFVATAILREPLERLLEEIRPDCLIADMFFPWTTDAAAKFGIPRLVFHGTSFFSLCVGQSLRLYEPHKKVSSDCEPFLMPNLPDDITLTRNELPRPERHDDESRLQQDVQAGIRIGVQEQALSGGDSIKSEALEKAVSQLMEGEEAEEMRSRAAAYGKMARKAVEEGGSSYSDLNALIDELSFCRQG